MLANKIKQRHHLSARMCECLRVSVYVCVWGAPGEGKGVEHFQLISRVTVTSGGCVKNNASDALATTMMKVILSQKARAGDRSNYEVSCSSEETHFLLPPPTSTPLFARAYTPRPHRTIALSFTHHNPDCLGYCTSLPLRGHPWTMAIVGSGRRRRKN